MNRGSISTVYLRTDRSHSSVDDQERRKRHVARARERRATVVLGIVMASFVGCWLPFFIIYPTTLLLGVCIPEQLFAVIFWLGYCNSALNPIIYTIFNREFRAAFQRMLCRHRRRRRQAALQSSISNRGATHVF
jgi:MFS family permease